MLAKLPSTLLHRDVTAGATGATAVAPKFSDTLTLFQPGWADSTPTSQRLHQNFPHGYISEINCIQSSAKVICKTKLHTPIKLCNTLYCGWVDFQCQAPFTTRQTGGIRTLNGFLRTELQGVQTPSAQQPGLQGHLHANCSQPLMMKDPVSWLIKICKQPFFPATTSSYSSYIPT